MSQQALITGLVVAVLVVFMIGRQFVPQRVNGGRFWILPAILTVYGLYSLSKEPSLGAFDVGLLVLNIVIGIVLGFARGYSMRYWRDAAGQMMRRGTILTAALWILSFGLRFGIEFAVNHTFTGQAQSELPLFMGATFGAQALAMWMRTQRTDEAATSDSYLSSR